jgi:hypothetical protein
MRSLFPKWNFFDRIAYRFELEFKIPESEKWVGLKFVQTRQPLNLLVNPENNLELAQVAIIEQFAGNIQELFLENPLIDSIKVKNLTTYKMLLSLLQLKLSEFDYQPDSFQFKVVAVSPSERLDFYISDWIGLCPL